MKRADTAGKCVEVDRLIKAERMDLLGYACYRLGNMEDAEDAVQDVCFRLHLRLKENDPEVINPKAYLYRSLANLCIRRKQEKTNFVPYPPDKLPELIETEAEDFEHEYQRIDLLLAEIPEEQADVIRLRFYGNKSFKEIADILGLPLTTVKSRFLYGLEKMKRKLHIS
ncbi:MAG: RNA polymerase sigma factor [Bacteroidaceae bacterium]|nr:RNA polymerase sigma factor [Bacteroidaceae bacterium]